MLMVTPRIIIQEEEEEQMQTGFNPDSTVSLPNLCSENQHDAGDFQSPAFFYGMDS